jgi:hypothetical protein
MNGANNEMKIIEIWLSKRPHLRLGLIVTMVGHGIYVSLADPISIFFTIFFVISITILCYQLPFDTMS